MGPARDQPQTVPSKVKVTTRSVVTSALGTTTEETTSVKTTSAAERTTAGETRLLNVVMWSLALSYGGLID